MKNIHKLKQFCYWCHLFLLIGKNISGLINASLADFSLRSPYFTPLTKPRIQLDTWINILTTLFCIKIFKIAQHLNWNVNLNSINCQTCKKMKDQTHYVLYTGKASILHLCWAFGMFPVDNTYYEYWLSFYKKTLKLLALYFPFLTLRFSTW